MMLEKLKTLEERVREVTTVLQRVRGERSALETRLQEMDRELEALRAALKRERDEREGLQATLQRFEAERTEFRNRIDGLIEEITRIETSLRERA